MNRYAVLNPATGKTYYVYGPSDSSALDRVDQFLKGPAVLSCTPAGQWDSVTAIIQNDPEPYLVYEGSVVARAQKA